MSNIFFPNYSGYVIASKFGVRTHPVTKVKKMHNGIDINASNDGRTGQIDDIMAHTGGTVESVGFGVSSGNYIKIRVDSETVMVYYHMKSQSPFKKGDTVKKGDIIGRVGKTGNVTGAHLHWGIKKNETWIDPMPYLDCDYPVKKEEIKLVSIELPVLKKGVKGEEVKTLQRLLLALGYKMTSDSGQVYGVDGSYGGATERAVCAFQKAAGLPATGRVESAEWNKLLKG